MTRCRADVQQVRLAPVYLPSPMCFVGALVYIALGVPQNFDSYTTVTTLEGAKQTIALGPTGTRPATKDADESYSGFKALARTYREEK